MQHVSDHWYRVFNYSVVGFSTLFVAAAAYFSWQAQTTTLHNFGLYPLTAGLATVLVLYGLIAFPLLSKKRDTKATSLVSMGLFIMNLLIISFASGGLDSPYIALLVLFGFVAGAYGTYLVITTLFVLTGFFIIAVPTIFDAPQDISIKQLGILAASYAVLGVGFALWRRSYDTSGAASPIAALSSELRQEHLQSEVLIESIHDGVVVINSSGIIELFNPAASKLSGWDQKDAKTLDYKLVLKFVDAKGKQIDEATNPFGIVLNKKEALANHDLMIQAKEGDVTEISMSVSPITDSMGRLTAIIAVMRDISVQKQQERQRAEFISTASHEMRTPVAAIEGYIALALNAKVSTVDDKARGFLTKAHEATQHLGMLFRDLLTASKSEDGRLENHPEPLEIGAFVQQVAEDVRFSAEKKGLTLTFTTGGQEKASMSPIYYAYVDPERMREVIVNLVDNAIKFTTKGGITLDLSGDSEYVQISVKDTGLGIAAEDIGHLFQKFYRIDNSATRTISGTGLGLFICKQIIELYKGRIWAESELGKGTQFFIKLPRLEQTRAERLIAQKKGTADATSQPVIPGTVIGQPEADAAKAAASPAASQAEVVTQPDPPSPAEPTVPEPVAAPQAQRAENTSQQTNSETPPDKAAVAPTGQQNNPQPAPTEPVAAVATKPSPPEQKNTPVAVPQATPEQSNPEQVVAK